MTKRGRSGIIINVVSARATTTAILENDIVKTRQTRENSQISERDNGLPRREIKSGDCEGLNIRV